MELNIKIPKTRIEKIKQGWVIIQKPHTYISSKHEKVLMSILLKDNKFYQHEIYSDNTEKIFLRGSL